jgi:cyclopropane-fatty-acyl-phospholipid synthase
MLAGLATRIGLAAARRIRVGRLDVVMPDGTRHAFGDPEAARHGELRIHDRRALIKILLHGETGMGEAYMEGWWSSPDLVGLIELGLLNRHSLSLAGGWWRKPAQFGRNLAHRARRNTHGQAKKNIAAHYDLGNDFYRLFLDETMTYSSAVFASPEQSLAEAQRNKYRLIAEGAGLEEGRHVLEIGTGWGGFAIYAAGEIGCRVTTLTISQAQAELARTRIAAAGLADLIEVRLLDYRELTGTYDAIVSIEMLEAVGAEFYETFFEVCDRALVPGGRLSLQTITYPDVAYEAQRRGVNWIQRYIFPGGLLPSLAVIERSTHGTQLLITRVSDVALDYVRTLSAWRSRFLGQLDAVRAQGFDERFIRMWEYYLAISEAGFSTGTCADLQIVFEKGRGFDRRP